MRSVAINIRSLNSRTRYFLGIVRGMAVEDREHWL